jgi:hypothetical protein
MVDETRRLKAKLITDTSSLITLAAAANLDYLLYLDLPVIIPDGVFYEAAVDSAKLGATEIRDWVLANPQLVRIAPTSVFTAAQASQQRVRSLGELSAIEAVQSEKLDLDERALLVFEDARAVRTLAPTDQIVPISTKDLLRALES